MGKSIAYIYWCHTIGNLEVATGKSGTQLNFNKEVACVLDMLISPWERAAFGTTIMC